MMRANPWVPNHFLEKVFLSPVLVLVGQVVVRKQLWPKKLTTFTLNEGDLERFLGTPNENFSKNTAF
jgi:hypothetical protein